MRWNPSFFTVIAVTGSGVGEASLMPPQPSVGTPFGEELGLLDPFYQPYESIPTSEILPEMPDITIQDVSLAIRWMAEHNRRLEAISFADAEAPAIVESHSPSSDSVFRISPPTQENNRHTTVFHAKHERKQKPGEATRRGIHRYGPEMHTFCQHLVETLDLDEADQSTLFSLTLLYLDRATSPETTRSNGATAVPFLTPRTAHRLVLAAFLIAAETSQGIPLQTLYQQVVEPLGISPDACQMMVEWMRNATGDLALVISPMHVNEWRRIWEYNFPKPTPIQVSWKKKPVSKLADSPIRSDVDTTVPALASTLNRVHAS